MLKLLKYELKRSYFPFVIVSFLYLVSVIILCSYIPYVTDVVEWDNAPGKILFTFAIICAIVAIIALVAVQIMTVISIFGKNLFGRYGYLLLCLPLSLDSILWAKILSAAILLGVSSLFYCLVTFLAILELSDTSLLEAYRDFIRAFILMSWGEIVYWWSLAASAIILSILTFLLEVLLTLVVLNVYHIYNFRFVIGLLIYLGIVFVYSCLTTIFEALMGVNEIEVEAIGLPEYGFAVYPLLVYYTEIIVGVVVLYTLSRRLILRKLELE